MHLLVNDGLENKTTAFTKLARLLFYQLFKDHIIENPDEETRTKSKRW